MSFQRSAERPRSQLTMPCRLSRMSPRTSLFRCLWHYSEAPKTPHFAWAKDDEVIIQFHRHGADGLDSKSRKGDRSAKGISRPRLISRCAKRCRLRDCAPAESNHTAHGRPFKLVLENCIFHISRQAEIMARQRLGRDTYYCRSPTPDELVDVMGKIGPKIDLETGCSRRLK